MGRKRKATAPLPSASSSGSLGYTDTPSATQSNRRAARLASAASRRASGSIGCTGAQSSAQSNMRASLLTSAAYRNTSQAGHQPGLRFFSGKKRSELSPEVVSVLAALLGSVNEYARLFKSAAEICSQDEVPDFAISNPRSEIQPLKTLGLGGDGAPIEVRMIRKWTPHQRPLDRCYLLVDTHGDAIQAVAHGQRNIRFAEGKLELHLCYRIEGYVCDSVDSYLNIISHPVHLLLGPAATITQVDKPDDFPSHYFEPMIYSELRSICDKKEEVTDYIGFLQRKEYRPTKSKDQMLKLIISDSRGRRITAALWKEVNQSPDKVDKQQLEEAELPTLIALTSVKVTDFMGTLQLQSTPATYLYINPVSPVIDLLLDRLRDREDAPEDGQAIALPPAAVAGDKITVAELQQMDRDMLNARTVIVEGTIVELHISKGWFYNACTSCPSPAKKSGDQWACASDGRFPAPRPTYCIGATIADHTGSIKTTLFDEAASLLIGKECSELIVTDGYTDPAVIPEPVQAARGKRKAFHLELQRDARPGRVSMTVTQVTEILLDPVLQIENAAQASPPSPACTTPPATLQVKPEPQPIEKKPVPPAALQVKAEPQPTEKKPVKRSIDFNAEGMDSLRFVFVPSAVRSKEEATYEVAATDGEAASSFEPARYPVAYLFQLLRISADIHAICAKQGDAIEAVFNIRERAYLEPRLAIMGCYELTNYECASAPDFYRRATNTAALYIDRNLNVRRMKDDFSIPWKYFNFLTFTEIRQRALRDDQLSDYIGKVIDLEEAHIGDRSPVLRMKLQEPGNRPVVLNLPEGIYNDINLENITTIDREVIVAATALKVKPSPGLELNETVPQYKGLQYVKCINHTQMQQHTQRSLAAFILTLTSWHGHIYTLAAVIVAISETEPWFDGECIACPPSSRVQHTGVVFSCESHGDKYVRYRAICTVRDSTGTAIVTILSPGINDIIGYDGCQMINVKECTNTRILPDPIREIIGTEWAFMVKSFDRNPDGQLAFISDDVRPITVIIGRGQQANARDGGHA
ncbi:hypothetical protein SSX86_009437 [Deinandra increscens subsp. villosa]|uniref:Replication factor A C-terminal domain-containing protein n=1 Tax=Deinandra increscens subsp. villosa TaxID=3103831 RepID=A0AAP0DGW8_9ASTR